MLKKLKKLLKPTEEKLEQFDILYKGMLNSDDYNDEKAALDKKHRRIMQLIGDCERIAQDDD